MLLDIIRFGHVIGIALGLGLAIYVDGRFLRALSAPIRSSELADLRAIHTHVIAAMGVLWVTGLALLYARTGFALSEFAPKLYYKIGVVSLLTINAVLIGRSVMPRLQGYVGMSFIEIPVKIRLQMALIGGISAACWLSLLALGVFQVFKTMGAWAIADVLRWFFVLPLTGALGMALLAPAGFGLYRYWVRRRVTNLRTRPVLRPQAGFERYRR